MINQRSSGIILYTLKNKKSLYLLLQHGGRYWNFPKGKIEPGETEHQTAFRETKEETGLERKHIRLHSDFRVSYRYRFRVEHDKIIHKEAVFYLGRVLTEKIKISSEHQAYGWFDYRHALIRLFYKNSQKLLHEAQSYIIRQVVAKN